MPSIYAKIKNGVVVNTQILSSQDYQDPDFVWIDLTSLYCADGEPIQIGCTYDGTNFYPQGN